MTSDETILSGRYQIVNLLGAGGFGQTFLAKDNQLPDRPFCVVKQLKPKLVTPQDLEIAKRLFDREAKTLHYLGSHDQIPRLFAHFEQDSELYLVQEFIEGQTLDCEIASSKQWNQAEIIQFLQDILQVLSFVHSSQVIHRDIKPANLMRRRSDRKIVLIDFGAVKALNIKAFNIDSVSQIEKTDGDTSSKTVVIGSPGYMPIEQQAGNPQFSSDIYAVGIVCLQILTGQNGRDIPKDLQTNELIWHDKIHQVNTELADFLDNMVCYDYRQRYQNASEALKGLQNLLNIGQDLTIPIRVNSISSTIITPLSPLEPSASILPQQSFHAKSVKSSDGKFERQQYRDRQILLNKVKNYWIKGVLENSLHGRAAIELGLVEKLDAVEQPWGLMWEMVEMPKQSLPLGTRIIDKFNELGEGRTLLILGEPGSGKTTTLLELARDLIIQAEADISIFAPVVFNLSSWQNKQSISDWLVQELNTKYQVSKELGRAWIEAEQLLLLLDGLDEVRSDRRQACVIAINQFIQDNGRTEIVVCSRSRDYADLSQRLRFQAAITVQALILEQVKEYLNSLGSELLAVSEAIQTDEILQELVRSPLILSVMTLAYQGISIFDLPQTDSIEERRRHLFNTYIERMFNRRSHKALYSKSQTKRWMIWLSQRLVQQSQTVFLIERIQPNWLEDSHQKWIYVLSIGLIGGLILTISFSYLNVSLFGIDAGLVSSTFNGTLGGLISALFFGLKSNQIETVEMVRWSWLKAKESIYTGFRIGLSIGVISALSMQIINFMLGFGLIAIDFLIHYLFNGIGVGLVYVLMNGLSGSVIEVTTAPNQGIIKSAKNALGFMVICIITLSILANIAGLNFMFGTIAGLLFGVLSPAGLACMQHITLRLVLYFNNYAPWNYTRFLDWTTQLIFLQKVGGGYIFIHRLLLEHFAQMSLD